MSESQRKTPTELFLTTIVEASQRSEADEVVRNLKIVSQYGERKADDGLQTLELRLRIACLFAKQTERLVRLADSRPAFLERSNKDRALSEHRIGKKALRYSGNIDEYVKQFNQRYEVPFVEASRHPLDFAATIGSLQNEATRDGVLNLITHQDFGTVEWLRDGAGMVKGAAANNLSELSQEFRYFPIVLRSDVGHRTQIANALGEMTKSTFQTVEGYLSSATIDLLPPATLDQ
jgi:hypothetical protein